MCPFSEVFAICVYVGQCIYLAGPIIEVGIDFFFKFGYIYGTSNCAKFWILDLKLVSGTFYSLDVTEIMDVIALSSQNWKKKERKFRQMYWTSNLELSYLLFIECFFSYKLCVHSIK